MNTKSQAKSREIVALQWLVTPLNEELDKLDSSWASCVEARRFSPAIDTLHAIGNIFALANLPMFSKLAKLLQHACEQMDAGALPLSFAPNVYYTNKLLRYELSRFVLTAEPSTMLPLRLAYLSQLLREAGIDVPADSETALDDKALFSQQLIIPDLQTGALSAVDYDKLLVAWRYISQQLLQANDNDGERLQILSKIADSYAKEAKQVTSERLWYVAKMWLDSLVLNELPKPHSYSHLLAQLEQAMTASDKDSEALLRLENLLMDIFVALAALAQMSDDAKELTAQLQHDSLFFPYVLATIERLIYAWGAGDTAIVTTFQQLQGQFALRGWEFFASYATQIIDDIHSAEGDSAMLAQIQWQVTTQLQDFYSAVANTYSAIDSAEPQPNTDTSQQLRQARILVENIKGTFSDYLASKEIQDLADAEQFSALQSTFDDMAMYEMSTLTARLGALFAGLQTDAPDKISAKFAYAMAESLALLELFLDGLAKEVFDNSLLSQVQEQLATAEGLMDKAVVEEFVQTPPVDTSVTRYSDSGEISAQEAMAESDTANDTPPVTTPVAPEALSEAYLTAKSALKEDDFEADEDIREIFVEEGVEVLEMLEQALPRWQANPDDLATLKDIRRGFHTLKGSGRMVGANQLGEMAWAVENLLNRVLDGTVKVRPELVDFILETTALIPALLQDFTHKRAPSYDPAVVVLTANNILAGRAPTEGVPSSAHNANFELQNVTSSDVDSVTLTETETETETETVALPEVLAPFIADAKLPVAAKITEVDDDIKEIFIEEAAEVLESIIPLFHKWKETPSDHKTLTDIRRGFHTLKGSGRMVGATVLGELAWAIENMLNRVLDNTVTVSEGMINLLADVLTSFDKLVALFAENSTDYPEEVVLWTATAHAYSKGLGGEFHYPFGAAPTSQGADKPKNTTTEAAADTALQSIKEAKDVLAGAEVSAPHDDEEDVLCQIFIEEAEALLQTVRQFIADSTGQSDVLVADEVVRAFHTLRGASGLAPLVSVGEVGAVIENSLQQLQRNDTPMTDTHLQALASAINLIEKHLADYHQQSQDGNDGTSEQHEADTARLEGLLADSQEAFDIGALIADLDTLLDAELELEGQVSQDDSTTQAYAKTLLAELDILAERTSDSAKFTALTNLLKRSYETLLAHPSLGREDDFVSKLLAAHTELVGLFDSLAGSMSLRLSEQVLTALSQKIGEMTEYYQALDDHTLIIEQEPAIEHTLTTYETVDTDAELLDIFLEEAGELDQAITTEFANFKDDTSNIEALKALQRHLHTIKGGARLAGIASIGDLTHEAETVYEQMVQGRLAPSVGWVNIMQGVQDILSLQIEELKTNKRTFHATQAVNELQKFLSQGVVSDDASITQPIFASDAPTPAVVPELLDEPALPISDFRARQLRSWDNVLPDADILEVFLGEAQELVESSTEDFQVFRSNTGDVATLQVLQRKLHTIKGGARMVQASGVADLAHEMETVYEDLASRRRPATRMVIQLLLACHDWLVGAMSLLQAKLNPPTPTSFIQALQAFSRSPDSLTEVPTESLAEELAAIAAHEAYEKEQRGGRDISRMPPMAGLFGAEEDSGANNEMIRISASLMERMINLSGEAAINRARIDMSMSSLTASIEEMGVTAQRLADQLRRMDIELEAQILAQIDDKQLFEYGDEGFDPLEMDQYSSLNQLSKSLSESASDLLDLKSTLLEKTRDGENLLLQLSRTQAELQDGLMYSRMVPFSRLTPRLQRIVRQVAGELGKQVELTIINADDEMDRTILERITSPLEHMLRNAIDHGIEMPDERAAQSKSRTGHIVLEATREGGEILIHLSDDGAGVNVEAVRKKAISQGLIAPNDTSLSDIDIMQYIFNAGLSTTSVVTQISGRGVGMDVVRSEIRQLGGSVSVDSVRHQGSRFTMRVPLTVAVTDTLVVRAADRQYAVPLVQIDRVTQVSSQALLDYYQSNDATLMIGGEPYRLRYLNEILSGSNFSELLTNHDSLPVILVKNQMGQNLALQVDEIVGSRIEVVVKPLGRQLSHVSGISAATIMGDGSVMFILDLMALIRNAQARTAVEIDTPKDSKRPVIMVVDDSVTVRKVTSRFLERQGFEVVVARDGVEAIDILQELRPDLMLLDIEMPRMDGFEVATQVRHNAQLSDLPIIMITSRTGEKHRERALEIGVTDYMGKPFQENELLERIAMHLAV